jgi:P pilus assembly chaperone PapD
MLVRRAGPTLALVLAMARLAAAQGVVVAPHAIYLDHRTRSASITLYNPGADPAEVTISTMYGYPVTDSLGHFMLKLPDSVDTSMPSATAWIDAFPRRMTVPPLARQTVRLLARPGAGLADGEYWSRVMISAKGGAVPVSGADTSGIEIGLTLEVRTIIPLIYRKGSLHTGILVSDLRAVPQGDSLAVRVRLERQGTAAYIGTAKGKLVNASGAKVASFDQPIAIYYDAEPSFALPLTGLTAGTYQFHLELSNDRPDIAPELLLRGPASHDSLTVVLP